MAVVWHMIMPVNFDSLQLGFLRELAVASHATALSYMCILAEQSLQRSLSLTWGLQYVHTDKLSGL